MGSFHTLQRRLLPDPLPRHGAKPLTGLPFWAGFPAQQGENHSRQHISAAAFGHTGVSCGIFKGLPIGKGGDGSVPLQHQHAAVLTGKRQSSGLTIRANGLPLPQPEKFPIVRGQDRQTATPGVQNIYMFCPPRLYHRHPKPAGSEAAPPNDRCAHPSFGFCPSPVQ